MQIKHHFSLPQNTYVTEDKNSIIVSNQYSLSFYSCQGKLERELVHFFQTKNSLLSQDESILITCDDRTKLKTIDLLSLKELSEVTLEQKTIFFPLGFTLCQDPSCFYMIIAKTDDFYEAKMMKDFTPERGTYLLQKRRVADLELVEEIILDDFFIDIKRFHKGYLMIRGDDSLFYFDEKEVRYLDIHSNDKILIDEKSGRILTMTEFGYRLYDSHFHEIQKSDFLSEETQEVDYELFSLLQNDDFEFGDQKYMEVPEEYLQTEIFINGRYLVCAINAKLSYYYSLRVIDVLTGKRVAEKTVSEKIEQLYPLKGNKFAFTTKDNTHIMEVVE
ncbi:MAG: hypothetical protein IJ194_06335 [Bacilli bacterium]|nr:hypothetical protein [Bacilli bacterium]